MVTSECCGSLRREVPVHLAVFLYYMGESMIINTALPYITYSVCRQKFTNISSDICLNINEHPEMVHDLQKHSALYFMAEKMISTAPALLLAAFLGPWSDAYGRKVPATIPYVGNILSGVLFMLAHYLQDVQVIGLVLAGCLIRALSGHCILLHLITFSYMADLVRATGMYTEVDVVTGRSGDTVTSYGGYDAIRYKRGKGVAVEVPEEGDEDQREYVASMCRLQVTESMGVVVGATLGWVLQKAQGAPLSLGMGMGLLLFGLLVVVLWLRDYHLPNGYDEQIEAGHSRSVIKYFLMKMTEFFRPRKLDLDPVLLWRCVFITFFMVGISQGQDAITLPFVEEQPLSWPNRMFSAYTAVYSVFQSLFLFVIAPAMQDHTVMMVSLVCSVAGSLWLTFSNTTWNMMLAGCLSHMTACIFPAIESMLSKHLPQTQVGNVLSRLAIAEGLATIVGPATIVQLFIMTQHHYPGLAFLASAAVPSFLCFIGIVLDAFRKPRVYDRRKSYVMAESKPNSVSRNTHFTQSLSVPSATVSGYGVLWCSSEW